MIHPIFISYHDICPNNFLSSQKHLDLLQKQYFRGAHPALMVVIDPAEEILNRPNFKNMTSDFQKPLSRESNFQSFKSFIKAKSNEGSPILVHGLHHIADSQLGRSILGKKALQITDNEAEFVGLGLTQASLILDSIIERWTKLDLPKPYGFVPPTWHECKGLDKLTLQKGFDFYEGRKYWSTQTGRQRCYPMSFWGKDLQSFQSSLKWNKRLFHFCRLLMIPLRLALHPADFQDDRIKYLFQFMDELSPCVKWTTYPKA